MACTTLRYICSKQNTFCTLRFKYTIGLSCVLTAVLPPFPLTLCALLTVPYPPLLLEIDFSLRGYILNQAYPRRHEEPSSRSGISKHVTFFLLPRERRHVLCYVYHSNKRDDSDSPPFPPAITPLRHSALQPTPFEMSISAPDGYLLYHDSSY